jgi:dethiobiotin synthetase
VNRAGVSDIIFITGTDTGVGKTVLTGLLLHHLRRSGCHALAMKPFCSGSRADAELLNAIQDGELARDEINPFFFAEPLAPLVAARKHRRSIGLPETLKRIKRLASRCQCLLVEGIGGVMVPLGEGFAVVDLIARLGCRTILVSRNRLGTINHTLLSVNALQHAGINRLRTVLNASSETDPSTNSNCSILSELLAPILIFPIPYLGCAPAPLAGLEPTQKNLKKTLARILA